MPPSHRGLGTAGLGSHRRLVAPGGEGASERRGERDEGERSLLKEKQKPEYIFALSDSDEKQKKPVESTESDNEL